MSDSGRATTGLLLAMMEPPPTTEAEFQDWYDSEHFPERAGCEGFETATRLICIDGWPKYLALYDLVDRDVLRGPGYAAVALKKYSPWTHRIIPQMWGQFRAEGVQCYPGDARIGAQGRFSRVVLWRLRDVPRSEEGALVQGFRSLYETRAETAQLRVFRSEPAQEQVADHLVLVELRAPGAGVTPDIGPLGPLARHVDLVNVYIPYWRQSPGAFPKS